MKIAILTALALGPLLTVLPPHAHATELRVFSSEALKSVLNALGPKFQKSTGNALAFTLEASGSIKSKIDQGAPFDVVIVTPPLLKALAASGKVDANTQAVIARSALGASVAKGAPKPDVSTPDALKRTLLNAKSIGFNGKGASRTAIEAILARLGVADALKPKIKLLTINAPEAVAKHEVELALSPISLIFAARGAELAGALPAEDQWYLTLSGAVAAASKAPSQSKALIQFLTGPAAVAVLKANGMELGKS